AGVELRRGRNRRGRLPPGGAAGDARRGRAGGVRRRRPGDRRLDRRPHPPGAGGGPRPPKLVSACEQWGRRDGRGEQGGGL
ncbi:MAG: hypothetical protein AVDCRST_MAG59-5348, partial [uncultured Thermomicrobiales bacterium]